jgi:hypothetical protein
VPVEMVNGTMGILYRNISIEVIRGISACLHPKVNENDEWQPH